MQNYDIIIRGAAMFGLLGWSYVAWIWISARSIHWMGL